MPPCTARESRPPNRHVLVVEDEPDLRDLMRILLEMEGYQVVCAANGAEALARLEADPRAAVILLDLAMPVMDGFTFRMRMLGDPTLARIPVILVSAIRPTGQPAAFLRPAAVVPKPVDPDVLLEWVGALCGAGASGTKGAPAA